MFPAKKATIMNELQADILRLQGFKSVSTSTCEPGLGPLLDAFPNSTFPLGAVHEFLWARKEDITATSGFIAGILSQLMSLHGAVLWISVSRKIFPPALKSFGVEPDRVVFIDVRDEKNVLWAVEEALKCGALSAVVGEVREVTFTASRRLQLAVEQSQVTGFIIHENKRKPNTTACMSRWKITSLPSEPIGDLPGIGYPKWKVELLRIRNGRPCTFDIHWANGKFQIDQVLATSLQHPESGIQYQESSNQNQTSGIRHPESSMREAV
jgi:protein ImuA